LNGICRGNDQLVTNYVAVCVIDIFETIEIDEEHANSRASSPDILIVSCNISLMAARFGKPVKASRRA